MNSNLQRAKKAKQDEFYTQLTDIEKELKHYREYFKGKNVFCNCDDPSISGFFHYFSYNFEYLGLKKLITTCYKNQQMNLFSKRDIEKAIYLEYEGTKNDGNVPALEDIGIKPLKGNGDFRSEECIEILKGADVVVTNPPFSLFREYLAQLIKYEKKFLIVGHMNALTYKEIFPLIKNNKIWLGTNNNQSFVFGSPYKNTLENNKKFCKQKGYNGDKYIKVPGINWYTNLLHKKRNKKLTLFENYYGHEENYPKYDNYDAIEVSRVVNIPGDFNGVMGVPITFLDKHNPEQFEIIWQAAGNTRATAPKEILDRLNYQQHIEDRGGCAIIKGKRTYARILIKRKIM